MYKAYHSRTLKKHKQLLKNIITLHVGNLHYNWYDIIET